MVESFWAIPDVTDIRTPLSILREQASALTEQTKGVLVGDVKTQSVNNGALEIDLELFVPALNNYRYRILTYRQPVQFYPGELFPANKRENNRLPFIPILNEEEFISEIKNTLSSASIKSVLTSLLAQTRDG